MIHKIVFTIILTVVAMVDSQAENMSVGLDSMNAINLGHLRHAFGGEWADPPEGMRHASRRVGGRVSENGGFAVSCFSDWVGSWPEGAKQRDPRNICCLADSTGERRWIREEQETWSALQLSNRGDFAMRILENGRLLVRIIDVEGRIILKKDLGELGLGSFASLWSGFSRDGTLFFIKADFESKQQLGAHRNIVLHAFDLLNNRSHKHSLGHFLVSVQSLKKTALTLSSAVEPDTLCLMCLDCALDVKHRNSTVKWIDN